MPAASRPASGPSSCSSNELRTARSCSRAIPPSRVSAATTGAVARAAGRVSRVTQPRSAARERQPLRWALARGHGDRERVPAVGLEFHEPGGLVPDRVPDPVGRSVACGGLEPAVGGEQQHRRVHEGREALDDRTLGVVLAQRVHEVQLHRRQPLQRAQVAARQRAVDDADHVPEGHRERDGEDGEGAGARLLQERRRHSLEDEVQAEAERGRVGRLKLGDQQALAGGVVAKPHAGGEHDPPRIEPGRRAIDLDRMGARHAPGQGVVAPASSSRPRSSWASRSPSVNADCDRDTGLAPSLTARGRPARGGVASGDGATRLREIHEVRLRVSCASHADRSLAGPRCRPWTSPSPSRSR